MYNDWVAFMNMLDEMLRIQDTSAYIHGKIIFVRCGNFLQFRFFSSNKIKACGFLCNIVHWPHINIHGPCIRLP